MLYGNLIFIKKTGGDGSKYPVTEKNIKIGRSENCLIRIYTPQVAPEHCQLIIDSNGQAKLRNLFTPTILNGKPLGQGDVTLCHGDVFKLGERLARWEYLPTSKYFKQLLSPTGRLVAVINPQRRSMEISAQATGSKCTPLGSKRKFSEKFGTENSSMAKQRKTVGLDVSLKPKIDLGKLLIGRHSIKTGKSVLKTPTLKQRKSVSGIIKSKTPRNKTENHRKSTLPSWKISVDAGPKQSTQNKKSPSKWPVKTPSKQSLKNEVRTPSKSTPIKVKTPKRLKLDTKSGDKTLLNTILESPVKLESARSTSSSKSPPTKVLPTPKHRSPVQAVRLVQSEKKLKATPRLKGFRKMSLMLKRVEGVQRKSAQEKNILNVLAVENKSQVQISLSGGSNVSGGLKSPKNCDASFNSSKKSSRKSVKSTTEKTPRNLNKPSNQSSVKKAAVEIAQTPPLIDLSYEGDSVNAKQTPLESVISSRKSLKKSVRKSSARPLDILQTPQKFLKNAETPSLGKTREEPSPSAVASPVSAPFGSLRPRNVPSSIKVINSSDAKKPPRGVRRKLSPSISSAERAAKKLKTSSPKKPDKNKRAALLVLGKANRKQLLSQNVKVLLKQKIVKKAIKQSVALPIRKDEKKKTSCKKIRKGLQKEKKKSANVSSPSRISQLIKEAPSSNKSIEKFINGSENDTLIVKKSPERSSLSRPKVSSPLPTTKVETPNTETVKSVTKSNKKPESSPSPKSTNETISPFLKFDKSSESYIFSSSRRCSKRLSSKNDTERPDFVELSPTALGLIPKNIEMFKTPKERKRKSLSLVTPKNSAATGIIKSASTSKIGNRKSVSFSSKDFSVGTTAYTPTINEKTDFDFDSFHTSNITMDVFVSPLNKSSATPIVEFVSDKNVGQSEKSTPGSKNVARKLLHSPQNDRGSKSSKFSEQTKTRTSVSESGVQKPIVSYRGRSSPKNDLTDLRGVKKLFDTPQKSPKNDLSDLKGVKKLMRTPRVQKSPKNDLSDVRGVKKLMRTPRIQKSPKNDLSDLRGVKKLMQTPRVQKSPKNDLSDVRGVKKLMQTPRVQKSPKNDLSDVRGVKKLIQTPRVQKSPKNDLSDVRGVKKLMQTPRVQKSPKNDLSDVRGVKKLMGTPKAQKSPKNDLSDLVGVKKLMQTPKKQNSPKNDLTDVTGVKQLLRTPKAQKSPQNNLSDVEGVHELFASSPKPKSGGVRKLSGGHEPRSKHDSSLVRIAKFLEKLNSKKEEMESEEKKSPGVSKTKSGRGRKRKLGEEKDQKLATPKTRVRKGSAIDKRPRVTRNAKQDAAADVEKEAGKRRAVRGRQTTRAKAEPVEKTTRTRAESKKEVEAPKAEASKTLRKRKTVEPVEAAPPKVRRKAAAAAAAKQSTLKVALVEPKAVAGSSTARKGETKSLEKAPGKSKTPAKKAKGQSKTTKSGVKSVSTAQKVQKGRSQTVLKQESLKSKSIISPRKTRAAAAKS